MAENFEELLSCKICSYAFQEDNDHTQKLLPCSHTLCKGCLIQLLKGGHSLTCPECREQHAAPNGQRTFCENRDLLTVMKLRESREEKPKEVPRCPDHGKELMLFCKEPQCQKLICSTCMKEHNKHDVVDVDEEIGDQKGELLTELTSTIDTLSSRKNHIVPAQITVDGRNQECLGRLRDEKEKTLSMVRDKYDSLIAVATNQKKESRSEMTSLEKNLDLLASIKMHVDKEALTLGDVKNCKETVSSIIQHTNHTLFEPCNYLHLEYKDCKGKERLVEELCGQLIRKQYLPESGQSIDVTTEARSAIPAGSSQIQCDAVAGEINEMIRALGVTSLEEAQIPKFKLKRSIEMRYTSGLYSYLYLSAAGRGSVFVCGKDADSGCDTLKPYGYDTLRHYNLVTGEELCTVGLEEHPQWMTTVLYNNRSCIALSYWNGGRVDFRPMDDLKQVVHRLDVSPHEPSRMCTVTSSPSQLLYCDDETGKIHRVDCSTAPLTPQGEIPMVYDGEKFVLDMCTSRDLQLIASYYEGVFAYTLPGGELKWRVSGKLPGMMKKIEAKRLTADDQGHLFVCDQGNDCVHALSAQDGSHLGVVVREGKEGVGTPYNVTWHQESKSLVVAHQKDNTYWHLSVFSRQE